jgi:hypothetical protein
MHGHCGSRSPHHGAPTAVRCLRIQKFRWYPSTGNVISLYHASVMSLEIQFLCGSATECGCLRVRSENYGVRKVSLSRELLILEFYTKARLYCISVLISGRKSITNHCWLYDLPIMQFPPWNDLILLKAIGELVLPNGVLHGKIGIVQHNSASKGNISTNSISVYFVLVSSYLLLSK